MPYDLWFLRFDLLCDGADTIPLSEELVRNHSLYDGEARHLALVPLGSFVIYKGPDGGLEDRWFPATEGLRTVQGLLGHYRSLIESGPPSKYDRRDFWEARLRKKMAPLDVLESLLLKAELMGAVADASGRGPRPTTRASFGGTGGGAMAGRFEGKVALVTGAGSGIGRAAALALAREGARVVVSDLMRDEADTVARRIAENGGQARFVPADVTRAAEVEVLVRQTIETFGRLDCAFNNAGVEGPGVPTHEHSEEDWDRVLAADLKGVWLCMRAEVPVMLDQGGGAIVNAASVLGLVAATNAAAYCAAKHAVVGLTRSAALDYARAGLRINAVCPGYIRTPMIDRVIARDPEAEERMRLAEPVGRLGTPEEVAEAVLWLCSDAASFVTGHALAIDGGLVAR